MRKLIILMICISYASTAKIPGPAIGVLSKPTSTELRNYTGNCRGMIDVEYTRFIEQGGARIVPINYTDNTTTMSLIFYKINALYFMPGQSPIYIPDGSGGYKYSKYAKAAKYLFAKAMVENSKGVHFPVLGTSAGMQMIIHFLGAEKNIYTECGRACQHILTNIFEFDHSQTKLFKGFPDYYYDLMKNNNVLYSKNAYIVDMNVYLGNKAIRSYLMATGNGTLNGIKTVFIVEGIQHPIFGVHFVPSSANLDWSPVDTSTLIHGLDEINFSQLVSNNFVQEGRLNDHQFASYDEWLTYANYNYPVIYDLKLGWVYILP